MLLYEPRDSTIFGSQVTHFVILYIQNLLTCLWTLLLSFVTRLFQTKLFSTELWSFKILAAWSIEENELQWWNIIFISLLVSPNYIWYNLLFFPSFFSSSFSLLKHLEIHFVELYDPLSKYNILARNWSLIMLPELMFSADCLACHTNSFKDVVINVVVQVTLLGTTLKFMSLSPLWISWFLYINKQ